MLKEFESISTKTDCWMTFRDLTSELNDIREDAQSITTDATELKSLARSVVRPSGYSRTAPDPQNTKAVELMFRRKPSAAETECRNSTRRFGSVVVKNRPTQLMSHFAELKKRLYISVAAILIATILAFAFYRPIQDFVQRPAIDALESIRPDDPARLVQLDITEGWTVTAKVSVLVGFAAAFPVVLYQVIMFVRPGLKGNERRTLYLLLPGGTLMFIAGAAFAYYVAIPPAIHFLLQFGGEIALVTPRLSSYVSLVSTLMIWLGLIFEIPIAMFLLAKLGILRPNSLSKQRRWVILFAFVLAAVVTPTVDPVTQALVAGPIIVLFELGLLLTRLASRKPEAENAADRKVTDAGG